MRTKRIYIAILLLLLLMAAKTLVLKFTNLRSFQLFGTLVHRVNTSEKAVSLTFDDGPGINTDTILHILRKYNVHATFFLNGEEMVAHPDRVRRILADGPSIGNHSYTHKAMIFKRRAFIRHEVETTDSLIRSFGYKGAIYFRPPYCKKLIYLPWYLRQTHRLTLTWDVEPDLSRLRRYNDALTLKDVQTKVRPGSIILLHAMYEGKTATLAALPGIIEWLQQNGYSLLPADELMKKNRP